MNAQHPSPGLRAHPFLNLLAGAFVLAVAPRAAGAPDTVTAQFLGTFNSSLGGSGYSDYAGQTFTAQVSGMLNTVSFQVADGYQSFPLAFDVLDMLGGVPNNVLAEVELPAGTVPSQYTLFPVDFSSFGIPLVAGTQYALTAKPAVNTTGFAPGWQFASGDQYAGGRGWWHPAGGWDAGSTFISSDDDFGFRVTVLVPESSSLALLLTGALCLVLYRCRCAVR